MNFAIIYVYLGETHNKQILDLAYKKNTPKKMATMAQDHQWHFRKLQQRTRKVKI